MSPAPGGGTPGSIGGTPPPDWDSVSVTTADEDAFDVTEAFDVGVDYDILDRADDRDDYGSSKAGFGGKGEVGKGAAVRALAAGQNSKGEVVAGE